jgi:hypothetical protein
MGGAKKESENDENQEDVVDESHDRMLSRGLNYSISNRTRKSVSLL